MRLHRDPYKIIDPNNIFEVGENSSHPELKDKKRIWEYKGRFFKTATECQTYLEDHGINWRKLKLVPVKYQEDEGYTIICKVVERAPQGQDIRELEYMR